MPVITPFTRAMQPLDILATADGGAAATRRYDCVIVGGGVTGLVVAHRLTEDNNSKSAPSPLNQMEKLGNSMIQDL